MKNKPLISLIIPIYCESQHLENFLQKIDALCFYFADLELIIIDDNSKDNSLFILKSFAFRTKHHIIINEKNYGKGTCIAKGVQASCGDIIGIQDCDFELDFGEIPSLVLPIINGEVDASFGNRFHSGRPYNQKLPFYLANKFITFASNILSRLYLQDASCCYKFFSAHIIKKMNLVSRRFGIDVEIIAKTAAIKNIRIKEVAVSYFPRSKADGKKITWKDGVYILGHIIYHNTIRKVTHR